MTEYTNILKSYCKPTLHQLSNGMYFAGITKTGMTVVHRWAIGDTQEEACEKMLKWIKDNLCCDVD